MLKDGIRLSKIGQDTSMMRSNIQHTNPSKIQISSNLPVSMIIRHSVPHRVPVWMETSWDIQKTDRTSPRKRSLLDLCGSVLVLQCPAGASPATACHGPKGHWNLGLWNLVNNYHWDPLRLRLRSYIYIYLSHWSTTVKPEGRFRFAHHSQTLCLEYLWIVSRVVPAEQNSLCIASEVQW